MRIEQRKTPSRKQKFRLELKKLYGAACYWCGQESGVMTVDHLIPKSKGGRDSVQNCRLSCHYCNNTKKNMHPKEFMRLRLLEIRTFFSSQAFKEYQEYSNEN